jgi:hypothetical protein
LILLSSDDLWVWICGMSDAVGMTAAHARRGSERIQGNIEVRGDSLRVRVYAGPDPVTGKPVYLRETVRGNDDAARRTARRTLNRLSPKRRRAAGVLGNILV